jgi:hypothetical protein
MAGNEAAYKEGGEHERLAGVGLAVHHLKVHEVHLKLQSNEKSKIRNIKK